jgi:hypothetical protein
MMTYRHFYRAKRTDLLRLARWFGMRGVSRLRKGELAARCHAGTVRP